MRPFAYLPLAAACLLAACGSAEEAPAEAGLSAEEVMAEAGNAVQPQPGQYSSTVELIDFQVPGVPDAMVAQMRGAVASGAAQGNQFCMTEADADPKAMLENLAESDCTFNQFAVTGGTIKADMSCKGEGGVAARVQMDGTMTAQSSTMTMTMTQPVANVGDATIKMRIASRRTGACS